MISKTAEEVRLFLDDLARLSVRHGLTVGGHPLEYWIEDAPENFAGYEIEDMTSGNLGRYHVGEDHGASLESIDVTALSDRERMMIKAGDPRIAIRRI